MNKRIYGMLFVISLLFGIGLVAIRPYTGYMDADYYYAGAKTLFEGKGYWDYYLWNYLSNPPELPAPSHAYWMPMASLVALAGMKIAGNTDLIAARSSFVLLFAFVPVLMAQLSWKVFNRKDWAIVSGFLALFCGYFLKFVTEPDGFVILFLSGILLIHLLITDQSQRKIFPSIGMGFLAGIIHLSRSDGILWGVFLIIFMLVYRRNSTWQQTIQSVIALVGGYLLVTAGWYLRIWETTGFPFPTGGIRTAFLTSYDEIFVFPPDLLNYQGWMEQGWQGILSPRGRALWINTLSVIAVFGSLVLIPGLLAGVRYLSKKPLVRFFTITAAIIYGLMTFVFPFVGMRGGLLHSGAIFMPAIWLIVPYGNLKVVDKIRSTRRYSNFSERFYQGTVVGIMLIISGFVLWMDRIAPEGLSQVNTWAQYQATANWLNTTVGPDSQRVVMVNNPPAYYAATGGRAIAIPFGDTQSILAAARQYKASTLILDDNYKTWFPVLFQEEDLQVPGFQFIGESNGMRVYQLEVGQ